MLIFSTFSFSISFLTCFLISFSFGKIGTHEIGMVMPPPTTSVRDICIHLGMKNFVKVLEVSSRSVKDITVEDWCKYFEQTDARGDYDLRLSKLSITSTIWGSQFCGPKLLNQLDWGCIFNIKCNIGSSNGLSHNFDNGLTTVNTTSSKSGGSKNSTTNNTNIGSDAKAVATPTTATEALAPTKESTSVVSNLTPSRTDISNSRVESDMMASSFSSSFTTSSSTSSTTEAVASKERTLSKQEVFCHMRTRGTYSDFRIAPGGATMWHYAHKGETWFYFISPTTENLLKYEQWYMSPDHEQIFFGDLVDHCFKVQVQTGQTLIIPSGWIHAMYTRTDSILFSSSLLHDLNIGTQIAIQDMEKRCGVANILPIKSLADHYCTF